MVTPAPSHSRILPIIIGNIFEWFDFALYGFFAGTIAKQFFPQGDAHCGNHGFPLFIVLNRAPSLSSLLLLQATLSACLAAYASASAALMASLFRVSRRSLGIGMGYNVGILMFGAFAPFITAWLIGTTGSKLVPAYYVDACAPLSFLVVLFLREPGRSPTMAVRTMHAA